jgi:hypothetical protein
MFPPIFLYFLICFNVDSVIIVSMTHPLPILAAALFDININSFSSFYLIISILYFISRLGILSGKITFIRSP